MKSMVIFLTLFSIYIPFFYCGEESEKELSESEIFVKYFTISPPKVTRTENEKKTERDVIPQVRRLPAALELVRKKKDKKKTKFSIRRDFIPIAETKNISTLAYFCPAESFDEHLRSEEAKYLHCLFLKDLSSAVLSSIECSYEPEPKLWNYPDEESTCGKNHEGNRYRFRHKVCWRDLSFFSKLPKKKKADNALKELQQEDIEVYSVCLRKQTNVLYLRHNLIVASQNELYRNKDAHELQTKTEGFVNLDLEKWPKLFDAQEQEIFLGKRFGKGFEDRWIPQMLISPAHFTPSVARNALHNYLNIKPQWMSVQQKWLQLEYHIWKLGLRVSKGIFIYAGTYDYDTVSENKKRKQLLFEIDETTTQSIPFIWWKLIMNKDKEGIILAVQNEPVTNGNRKPFAAEKLCDRSICNSHGWSEINDFAYCCAFDESKRKLLNLHAEKIQIIRVFNPMKHRSRLTKWLMNVLKLP